MHIDRFVVGVDFLVTQLLRSRLLRPARYLADHEERSGHRLDWTDVVQVAFSQASWVGAVSAARGREYSSRGGLRYSSKTVRRRPAGKQPMLLCWWPVKRPGKIPRANPPPDAAGGSVCGAVTEQA